MLLNSIHVISILVLNKLYHRRIWSGVSCPHVGGELVAVKTVNGKEQ